MTLRARLERLEAHREPPGAVVLDYPQDEEPGPWAGREMTEEEWAAEVLKAGYGQ